MVARGGGNVGGVEVCSAVVRLHGKGSRRDTCGQGREIDGHGALGGSRCVEGYVRGSNGGDGNSASIVNFHRRLCLGDVVEAVRCGRGADGSLVGSHGTVVNCNGELPCRRWRSRDGYAELVVVGSSLHGEGEGGSVDRERASCGIACGGSSGWSRDRNCGRQPEVARALVARGGGNVRRIEIH